MKKLIIIIAVVMLLSALTAPVAFAKSERAECITDLHDKFSMIWGDGNLGQTLSALPRVGHFMALVQGFLCK